MEYSERNGGKHSFNLTSMDLLSECEFFFLYKQEISLGAGSDPWRIFWTSLESGLHYKFPFHPFSTRKVLFRKRTL